MSSGEQPPSVPRIPMQDFGPRHREILDAAAALIAERGYGGMSLRELARRVGLRQPSLYHYFDSKEQLVEQIIEACAGDMFVQHEALPEDFADAPAAIVRMVDALWSRASHVLFFRVAVAVGRLEPRFGARLREIFEERSVVAHHFIAGFYRSKGELLGDEEMIQIMRMTVSAVAFRRLEFEVFYDPRPVDEAYRRYADGVAETMRSYVLMRRGALGSSQG